MQFEMARKQHQVIVDFIELYRTEPRLWQVKSEEYHDHTKKDVAYSKLVKKLEELDPGATKSVLMKINSLRSAYRKNIDFALVTTFCTTAYAS